jgi:hypothetical protein
MLNTEEQKPKEKEPFKEEDAQERANDWYHKEKQSR